MLEATDRSGLAYELRKRSHRAGAEVALNIRYESLATSTACRLDRLVHACAVMAPKALEKLLPLHEAQLATYTGFAPKPVGLLLNFRAWLLKQGDIKRIAWNPPTALSPHPQTPTPHLSPPP